MSLFLFNLLLNSVLKRALDEDRGIRWGPFTHLEGLDYADDVCLLSHIAKLSQLRTFLIGQKALVTRNDLSLLLKLSNSRVDSWWQDVKQLSAEICRAIPVR